ncbi:Protein of unknown function [Pyronema omphalodes CBS 100304]|uniref:Uncharacterized protein n=1 Tax=Pyronema omphalodes (strain CBS 100304) TaxID=1076935 RepID=U4LJY4_PYROM|nr:Protein of unknown function [Pyronema omphalodes CBS 100304]
MTFVMIHPGTQKFKNPPASTDKNPQSGTIPSSASSSESSAVPRSESQSGTQKTELSYLEILAAEQKAREARRNSPDSC